MQNSYETLQPRLMREEAAAKTRASRAELAKAALHALYGAAGALGALLLLANR
jgi:hypothetical protein